jgi:hypothetical protein
MKKTLLYIVLLGVLIGGLYVVFNKKDTGFSEKESNFTIKDTGSIGKIYMVSKKGEEVLLERSADGWMLNKKYRAMASPVNTLLTTFRTQVGKFPAPAVAHDNIVKGLAGNAIKVQVFDRSGGMIREFYVGGETKDYNGSYMLMAGAERPFAVEIPGFPGYLTPRYSTDEMDWRDRSIFLLNKERISRISLQYTDEPLNSFVVNQSKDGKITVETDPGISQNQTLNERRVELFLGFFQKVYCEGYVTGQSGLRETIDTIGKLAAIDVTTTDGQQKHLDIYWRPLDKRSKNLIRKDPNTPENYDADRGYAVLSNMPDTMSIQFQAFDKIFRKAYEFYEQDQKPVKALK